jgi:hypothetical protein
MLMRDENEKDLYKYEAHRQYYVTSIYVNLTKLALVVAFMQSFLCLSIAFKQGLGVHTPLPMKGFA